MQYFGEHTGQDILKGQVKIYSRFNRESSKMNQLDKCLNGVTHANSFGQLFMAHDPQSTFKNHIASLIHVFNIERD